LNGTKVSSPRELAMNVAGVKPDSDATLSVLHDGQTRDVTVHVGTLPNDQTAENGSGGSAGQEGPHIGLALAPLSPQTRQQLQVPENASGAVVAQVQPGSPADKAGLQPGDVVVDVGGKRVGSPDEAANALRGAARAGKPFALRILRNGQGAFVAVKPTEQNG
jgi:serine protease Do